jgi:diadenosine tetraphosphate (Ap4A) HIT family hydrolase
MKADCIFCKLIAKQIPASIVYEVQTGERSIVG